MKKKLNKIGGKFRHGGHYRLFLLFKSLFIEELNITINSPYIYGCITIGNNLRSSDSLNENLGLAKK